MIRYALNCDQNHQFESWFQSAAAFEKLHNAGLVACAVCGSAKIEKLLMAPAVRPARTAAVVRPLGDATGPAERALAAMRRHVEENSEYVGMNFATEARAIHDGDSPERAIYGEARVGEARRLIEDGVPVAPLPFLPTRKAH